MPTARDGLEPVRRYLEAVVRRAEHHLLPFPDVTSHVLVEVILRHDVGSLDCHVPSPTSASPIELRFAMQGAAYALAYTHAGSGPLELRDAEGAVACVFRTGETWARVNAAFNKL